MSQYRVNHSYQNHQCWIGMALIIYRRNREVRELPIEMRGLLVQFQSRAGFRQRRLVVRGQGYGRFPLKT